MNDDPSSDESIGRSPESTECRGSESACANSDGTKAIRVSRMARAGLSTRSGQAWGGPAHGPQVS